MTTSKAKIIRVFNHQKQPASPESLRQWLDTELTNLQSTLSDVIAAIKQLQTTTGV